MQYQISFKTHVLQGQESRVSGYITKVIQIWYVQNNCPPPQLISEHYIMSGSSVSDHAEIFLEVFLVDNESQSDLTKKL